MNRVSRQQPTRHNHLKVCQANVRRSGPTHDIALNIAAAENADIILLQEPSCMAFSDGSALTTTYDCHSPSRHWTDQRSTHPRVLSYTRKGHGLLAGAPQDEASRGILGGVGKGV